MIGDYCKMNQVMMLFTETVPDVTNFLEQVNKGPGNQCAATDPANALILVPNNRDNFKNYCLLIARPVIHFHSYPGTM